MQRGLLGLTLVLSSVLFAKGMMPPPPTVTIATVKTIYKQPTFTTAADVVSAKNF